MQIIEAFARNTPFPVVLVRQDNCGADVALNRGMALARGDILSLLNSDDMYAPERLARMLAALNGDVELAFSDVELVDDDDRPSDTPLALRIRGLIDAAAAAPELIYALIGHNIATSTGNLVLRRRLLERIGGFASLKACHDWDFVLRAAWQLTFALSARGCTRTACMRATRFPACRWRGGWRAKCCCTASSPRSTAIRSGTIAPAHASWSTRVSSDWWAICLIWRKRALR